MRSLHTFALLVIAFCWSSMVNAQISAQTNQPVGLALIVESSEASTVGDVLTAELSKNGQLHLLERTEIEKVYREQGLSAANKDYLKLGQILGADGLWLFEINRSPQQTNLTARLIAVKPGVLLLEENFSWPLPNVTEWAPLVANHLHLFLPKLTVLVKDAIPISVVNLRSAIQSVEALETERQLKLLVIQRLSRERQLFVLERQRTQLLSEEKSLKGMDDSAFWNGSYLLEGVVDQSGYSKETVTINARLTPPKGGTPLLMAVSGSRTNFAGVVNQLAIKVSEALKVASTVTEWNAADEAQQYFEEAKWAMRWGVYSEAQMAAESAWTLGRRSSETAALRIRAYSQSVPLQSPVENAQPENVFRKQIVILAIPDKSQIKPLARAMELFCQDTRYMLNGTNGSSTEGFTIGLQLLRRTAGLLESYRGAAEMRAGDESQLSMLREAMRLTLATLDAYPPPRSDKFGPWNDPWQTYNWLKWEEGGICFDQPEEVLPIFRRVIESGYHPEHLPRLVGWSGEIPQNGPRLMYQFVDELCTATNPAVRLEGLYLRMVQVPLNEKASLQAHENELLSAMWENRQWLFSNGENVSLMGRTENALRSKYDDRDSNAYYDREPFAGFKHRLRMDFLQQASNTNRSVFWALFPITDRHMETPVQARELLPLMESYEQKLPMLAEAITHLRRVASVADSNKLATVKPVAPVEDVLEAKFIKWNLPRLGIDSDRTPQFHGMVVRSGKLWLRVRYWAKNSGPVTVNSQTTYIAVDPQSGVKEEIPFPARLGVSNDAFEVTADSLFVNAQGHLYRFKFQEKIWEEIPVPMEDSSQLVWSKGNLFVARSDSLLKVNPDSKEVQVLVSSRRQPSMNEIDPLWTAQTLIYPRSDGKLGALSGDHCFCFDSAVGQWNIRTQPLAGTNNYFTHWNVFTSAGGAQRLLTGAVARRYLIGYWNDNGAPQSLLAEQSPIKMKDPANERRLQPVRWDWPQSFPLEPSSILADDEALWILCPRKVWQNEFAPLPEDPVKFIDGRQATLFHFDSEFRQAQSVAVHFENNGQSAEPLMPLRGGFSGNWDRLVHHIGNAGFWLKTPHGLVFSAPAYCGHWFIPNSALEPRLEAQRQLLRQQSRTSTSMPANLPKP